MKIIADASMPYVTEAFADFGTITLRQGRTITHEMVADANLLLVRSVTRVTKELIAGTSLAFIASATSGIEHVDCSALLERGIGFAHAPGSNAHSVAQYVVSAMLSLAKARKRKLSDMVLGIIGVGNVGSRLLRYAEGLGMRCLLNDPPRKRLTGNKLLLSLEEVVEASDILTLHVPMNRDSIDATYHLVNKPFLKRMKPGAVLINTSRGNVVDEAVVKEAGAKLGGLVVDVWNHEPAIDPEYLAIADIATPHIAGYSFDGKVQGTSMVHRAACDFFHHRSGWSPEKLLSELAEPIDVAGSADPVGEAVKRAYDILSDDAKLRTIAVLPESEQGPYFDSLRANYQKRFEFAHYEVRCGADQTEQKNILESLGFKTSLTGS